MSEKQTRNNIYLFLLITVCLVTILTSCFPNNPTTPEAVTINKTIELKDSGPKTFSIKSSQGVLPLPFNSSHCGGCQIEAKAHLYYSDNKEEIITQRGGITIGSNGNVSIGASTIGGNLYSGTTVSVVGTMSPASSITGSVSPNMDTSGKPCGYKASHRTHDSSAITIPTYFFRSGSINISLEGKDLVASVTGITSSDEAYWIAPWDGSCRTGSKHPNYITSGTLTVKVKNVVQVTDDNIELTVNPSSIGTESGVTSSTITVDPTNTSKEWKLKIKGNKEGCQYTKEYTGTGKKDISWPDADVNSLANGSYSLDAFYTEEPENKASGSIEVKNKIELKASIPGKDEDEEKIFSAAAGGSADFKITAGGCPQWELKIQGKKPDIINSDGSKTPGESCEWTKEGSGNTTVNWTGICNDGDLMEDGSYTANLTQGDDSKDDTVKVDNTPPEIENVNVNESESGVTVNVSFKDPSVNGVSSGLDDDSVVAPQTNNPNISISKSGNSITINVTIKNQDDNSPSKAMELFQEIKSILSQVKASDKVKNTMQFQNIIEWTTRAGVVEDSQETLGQDLSFNTLAKGDISPHKNIVPLGGTIYNNFRCQRVEAEASLINPRSLSNLSFNVVLRRQKVFDTSKLTDLVQSFFYKGSEVARWSFVTNGVNPQIENFTWYGYFETGKSGSLVESGLYAFFIEPAPLSRAFFAPATFIGQVNVVNTINSPRNYKNSQDTTGDPVVSGKDFTPKQKDLIKRLNRQRNGGILRSDVWPYEILTDDPKDRAGGVPCNYAEVDHILPKKPQSNSCASKGSNEFENAQVIPRCLNNPKRNLFHY